MKEKDKSKKESKNFQQIMLNTIQIETLGYSAFWRLHAKTDFRVHRDPLFHLLEQVHLRLLLGATHDQTILKHTHTHTPPTHPPHTHPTHTLYFIFKLL